MGEAMDATGEAFNLPGPVSWSDQTAIADVEIVSVPVDSDRRDIARDRDIDRSQAWLSLLPLVPAAGFGRLMYCYVWKRVFDLVAASVMLLILSPVLLIIAIAIRLDSRGPAIYRQIRVGHLGRPFTVLKFRTMRADPTTEYMLFKGQDGRLQHKIKDDPRVTRLGRIIRKTSLDELPQLFNVVRGEMSLVGPRPELPQIVRQYQTWQHHRHLVRPGMTGWWQVHGRSELPMHENTELDVHYVEHLSPVLDAKILVRTVLVVIRCFGAF
jgi:exopolysaccharide biosynthesis polyprenyl glycosylphosphotransferase